MIKLKNNKLFTNILYNVIPLSSITLFISTVFYWNNQSYGLTLSYDGKEIATVQNEETIVKACKMIKVRNSSDSNDSNNIIDLPKRTLKIVNNSDFSNEYEIKNKIIEESLEGMYEAVGIYSDGKCVIVVNNIEDAQAVLDELKENAKLGDENSQVEFIENVEIIQGLYSKEEIQNKDSLKDIVLNGVSSRIEHIVNDGETLETISNDFNIDIDKLKELNNLESNDISPGDKLIIEIFEFPIHIKTIKFEDTNIEIPYQTIREEDKSSFEGTERIDIHGQNGLEIAVNKVTYINGNEIGREEISRQTVTEVINEHVFFGTKKKETSESTKKDTTESKKDSNTLVWPVPYTHHITSKYGAVDGAYRSVPHTGIDIAESGVHGKDIVAATDGKVSYSGVKNGYGNCVKITHSKGNKTIETLYAHCENLCVSEGQNVHAGEKIATVGSTGNSTGYHVHFETIENGKRVNPESFSYK